MFAVGRIGSYISRGVYTVSGPFHPFGGAVDIIVVQQEDGSFKSSPWYVRFGKFQGVLKSKEKVVDISINGKKADFHMHLDNNGQSYFVREMIVEEEDSLLSPSSGEDTDGQPLNSDTQVGVSNGTIVASTNSQRSQIFGFVFRKNSVTENRCQEDGAGVLRTESLDRAEMAADLLDMKWSTSLVSRRYKEENTKQFSPPESSDGEFKDLDNNDKQSKGDSDISPSDFQEGERFVEESGGEMSYSVTEGVTATSSLSLSSSGGHDELNSKMSRKIDKLVETLSHPDKNAEIFISEIAGPVQKVLDTAELEACPVKQLGKEQNFDERNVCLPEQNGTNGVQSFLCCEIPESSIIRLDGPGEGANGTLKLSSVKCEVCIHAKTEDETTVALSEVNSQPEATLSSAERVKKKFKNKNCCNFVNEAKILENGCTLSNSIKNCTAPKTHSKMVVNNLVKEVESWSTLSQNQEEKKIMEKNTSELQSSLESAGNQQDIGGSAFTNAIYISSSESLEEEQLLFGEPDDLKLNESKSPTPNHMGKKCRPPLAPQKVEAVHESAQEDVSNDFGESWPTLKSISSEIDISRYFTGEEAERMAHSLPNLWSHDNNSDRDDLLRPLGNSPDKISKTSKWMLIKEDLSSCIKLQEGSEYQLPSGEPQNVHANSAAGGSWGFWPFALKKSRSIKAVQPALDHKTSTAENYMGSASSIDGEKDSPKSKINKKIIRANMPTSDQLASSVLKEGKNIVTFTFSTPVLGTQEVDARIYLWRWDTRIVISDVDGTITKSDVLGQFMPLVGMDWSHTGVTHLFSAIKENGYQLIFLSARAISQAYHTRQFLLNLKQDGKALPDGPVVISPDGLFPSLFREVIRRAPHEFKIACLEDIKALFPADRNPFYAGFGNRDTDEISYLKVGIPRGKIFIINPKGEVAVNRGVDTKSYTSLHALVHDMFPPMSSSEQEDFNSWNFWKLPPPGIDI